MNATNHIVKLDHVSVGYDQPIIKDVNLGLQRGKIYLLVGRNGTGKSTLLKTMAGIIPCLSGQVEILEKPLGQYNARDRAKHIRYLSPRVNVGSGLSASEVMELGQFVHGFSSVEKKVLEEKIADVAARFGISTLLHRPFSALSDGERQKVLLGAVWIQNPQIILLDEPTSFLDFEAKPKLLNLLIENARNDNKCLIIASHDLNLVTPLVDEVLHIDLNRIELMPATAFSTDTN